MPVFPVTKLKKYPVPNNIRTEYCYTGEIMFNPAITVALARRHRRLEDLILHGAYEFYMDEEKISLTSRSCISNTVNVMSAPTNDDIKVMVFEGSNEFKDAYCDSTDLIITNQLNFATCYKLPLTSFKLVSTVPRPASSFIVDQEPGIDREILIQPNPENKMQHFQKYTDPAYNSYTAIHAPHEKAKVLVTGGHLVDELQKGLPVVIGNVIDHEGAPSLVLSAYVQCIESNAYKGFDMELCYGLPPKGQPDAAPIGPVYDLTFGFLLQRCEILTIHFEEEDVVINAVYRDYTSPTTYVVKFDTRRLCMLPHSTELSQLPEKYLIALVIQQRNCIAKLLTTPAK